MTCEYVIMHVVMALLLCSMVLHHSALCIKCILYQQLYKACEAGDVQTVQRLLSLGVNVNDEYEVHVSLHVDVCSCDGC